MAQTQINLPFITATDAGPLHLDYALSRARIPGDDRGPDRAVQVPFERAIRTPGSP